MNTRHLSLFLHGALAMLVSIWGGGVHAQIIINQTQSPNVLVNNVLMGSGVFPSNVTFNGVPGATVAPVGVGPSEIGRFNGTNTCIGINGGVLLCPGVAQVHIPGPNDELKQESGGIGAAQGIGTADLDLSHVTGWPMWQVSGGSNIYNKAVLEFDFVPVKDMVQFRYVFSSEEYEAWACSEYNDVFAWFVSGPGISGPYLNNAINIAYLPGSMDRVCINSVNSGLMNSNNDNGPNGFFDPYGPCLDYSNWQANAQYYRYNGGLWGNILQLPQAQLEAPYNADPYYIEHNGMTVVLTASAAVQCGQTYHMKMAIANVLDSKFQSAVFMEQESFESGERWSMDVLPGPNVEFVNGDTIFYENDCDSVYLRFHRWGGFYLDEYVPLTVIGSATEGVDYNPPLAVHFNQLDSTVVFPIAVHVDDDTGEEEIRINISCTGQTHIYKIRQRPPLVVELDDIDLDCPGIVTLTPEVSGGSGDPTTYTYEWSTGETTPSISPLVLTTTQFWVTVSDSCWAFPVTDSAWVTVPPYDPMVLTVTPDTAIPCLGSADLEVSATLGSGGYTYEWFLNDVSQGTGQTLTITAPIAAVYYVAEVTDLCGVVAADSVLVSQAPPVPLVIEVTPDTAIACLGHADLEVTVTGGGGIISYAWTNGAGEDMGDTPVINVPAAELEVYTVQVSDQCGQLVEAEVEVTTGPTPPLVVQAEGDTALCANEPLIMQVLTVTGGGGAYSYRWSPGGAGPNNEASFNVNVPDDAFFTVTVTDECGNSTDTTLTAVVLDFDPLTITTSNDTLVCPGEQVPLWVQVSGGAGENTITWSGIGTGESVTWRAGHDAIAAVVQVVDACGETVNDTVHVDVYPARAWIHAAELGDGDWRFEARTIPEEGVDLEWDLGDGTSITDEPVVEHTYTNIDAHWVYLYMVTPDGCEAVDSVQTTPPSGTLYFPNAFSPNGDKINDSFGGEGTLLDRYELYVFDRWGGIIFESKDQLVRWDGTMEGEEVMNGVYQYKYLVKGQKIPLKQGFGHVTLVR